MQLCYKRKRSTAKYNTASAEAEHHLVRQSACPLNCVLNEELWMGLGCSPAEQNPHPLLELLNTEDPDNSWLSFTSEEVQQLTGNWHSMLSPQHPSFCSALTDLSAQAETSETVHSSLLSLLSQFRQWLFGCEEARVIRLNFLNLSAEWISSRSPCGSIKSKPSLKRNFGKRMALLTLGLKQASSSQAFLSTTPIVFTQSNPPSSRTPNCVEETGDLECL